MTGRAYTMKEMRGIVEYIKERKAFSEVRAKKMWVDFASSDLTNRSWQSLKETFLKRILPDIYNPYYKLTQDEIRSFREGREHRPSQNKLEFKSASPEQNTVEDNEEPSTSHSNQNGHKSGEDITCSKVDTSRESVDTVILADSDTLENPKQRENNIAVEPLKTKSLRDCISFTEPLTPMMEILKDFSSDEEPLLTIDEGKMDNLETVLASNNNDKTEKTADKPDTFDSHPLNNDDSIKRAVRRTLRRKSTKDASVSDSSVAENTRATRSKKSGTVETAEADENSNEITPNKTPTPTPNSITDSLLPNNQEALLDKESDKKNDKGLVTQALDVQKTKAGIKTPKSLKKTGNSDVNESDSGQVEVVSSNEVEPPSTTKKETSAAPTNINATDKERTSNDNEIVEVVPSQPPTNPCLQSISLYEEQFNTLLNSDNEAETTNVQVQVQVENHPNKMEKSKQSISPPKNKMEKNKMNKSPPNTKETPDLIVDMADEDVMILKSDSDSNIESQETRRRVSIMPKKATNFKKTVLQNLFDGVSRKQKRQRHRSSPILSSESSEWTSESDEYVAPPRALSRHSRKYLKPNSGRILALGQEGGLFVACGKKVYPIVKDGRIVKNYLTFDPDSETEEREKRESYWQKKYLEEKKRTAELTKLLESREKSAREESNKRREAGQLNSPILPSKPPKIDRSLPVHDITSSNENIPALGGAGGAGGAGAGGEVVPRLPEQPQEDKTVKIKFAKANEEVCLEGHWQNLHHILGDVMQIFHKDKPEERVQKQEEKSNIIIEEAEEEVSPRPKDRNIDQLENEILREIEEKDKSAAEDDVPHVTERKRRGRPPSRLSRPTTPAKRQKLEENDRSDSEIIVNENKLRPVDSPRLRALRRPLDPPEKPKPIPIVKSPRKTPVAKEQEIETDNETLYKFPSPEPQKRGRTSKGKKMADFASKSLQVMLRSPESTQGYQDTDDSVNYNLRRKRKSITYVVQGRKLRDTRKEVYEFDASDESSNPLPGIKKIYQNVTVNTEVYRTESYNLLLPKVHLTRLEASPCPNEVDSVCGNNSLNLSPASQNLSNSGSTISINVQIDSSNVSLPLSPELSIVENISVNRNVLNTVEYPTINETQQLNPLEELEKYLMSEIDVEVPLMQQQCNVKPTEVSAMDISEGIVPSDVRDKDNNPTISETLDEKMRKLLLESAKKGKGPKKGAKNPRPKKTPAEKAVKAPKAQKINQKRCSTPRKKKDLTLTKSKAPSVDAVLEEQMEYCTSGRRSCPPVISDVIVKLPSKRVKKQKDIIKVKIQRPKKIDLKRERKSTHTDSGINDTMNSVFLNNTVDLIHNHSESCVTNECYDYDSVMLVENSVSVVSINSTLRSELDGSLAAEVFSSDAQDGSSGFTGLKPASTSMPSPSEDYHTPPSTVKSFNSLITEDLDELPKTPPESGEPSKTRPDSGEPLKGRPDWYFFSDEEITAESTNCAVSRDENRNLFFDPKTCSFSNFGFNTEPPKTSGSNLKHLFPVTCTVPNLSTISELSRETEINSNTGDVVSEFDVDSLLDEFVSCSGN